jgi:1,2-phenylacetyl-CoA epoxidase catalytic subunit
MTTLAIQIDADIAKDFQASPPEQQQKIQTLINQWMRQALKISTLQTKMDKLSDEAESNGLTPEILQSILYE